MKEEQLIEIFCEIDDFCKKKVLDNKLLTGKKNRGPNCSVNSVEIGTILIVFHLSNYRNFKHFYKNYVIPYMHPYFKKLPSYNRFIEIQERGLLLLTEYISHKNSKSCKTGQYYIDSSSLPVCHNLRINRHKTFGGLAERGKTSVGWFFGFKLHLVINHMGEIMNICITKGNKSDVSVLEKLTKGLKGMICGDKGYISFEKANKLLERGLKLITRVRKNMKKQTLTEHEKQLLNQRGMIESVIGIFKFGCNIWHTAYRSATGAFTNLIAGIAAYSFLNSRINAFRLIIHSN